MMNRRVFFGLLSAACITRKPSERDPLAGAAISAMQAKIDCANFKAYADALETRIGRQLAAIVTASSSRQK